MTGDVRLAATGILTDGSRLVWTVADGRRGRRWRAVAGAEGTIRDALLLEVDTEGRPSRLELTTPAGLLTLHPDDARRWLHGNVVGADGVRHLRLPWSNDHGFEVEGRPLTSAVSTHRLSWTTAVGEGRTIPVVLIDGDLNVSETTRRFERLSASEWRIGGPGGGGAATTMAVDARGVPTGIGAAREWPLELD